MWLVRVLFTFAVVILVGCAAQRERGDTVRSPVLRDVESYAIAACLAGQSDAYLKGQGDAWASVIVQRMRGDVELLEGVAAQIKRENALGDMAVIRDESQPQKGKPLPLLHCGEVIDRPAVRQEIEKAVTALRPAYAQR